MSRIVLVGGGVAAAATATGLREEGFDGGIVIVAAEPHLPYERPPLSKEYLAGSVDVDDLRANPEAWYTANDVEPVLGARAEALWLAERRVSLADGRSLDYDALVLGTGVRARKLDAFSGERVHALRTLGDAERLGPRLVAGSHLVVLGGGFIGCEVAAIAAERGVRVTVFEPGPLPLGRVLGAEFGRAVVGLHTEHGVQFRTGQLVTAMTETATGLELTTREGEVVECDELLVGVGSVPNDELAAQAGLDVDRGILTDEDGRTAAPNVHAIGDVAVRFHPELGRRTRVEHHDTAVKHGRHTARVLLGHPEPFADQQFFWSHQYDNILQSLGHAAGEGEMVFRGSVDGRSFARFSLVDGHITGLVALNRPKDVLHARKVMAGRHEVTPEQLADEDVPLKSLLPQRAGTRRSEARR